MYEGHRSFRNGQCSKASKEILHSWSGILGYHRSLWSSELGSRAKAGWPVYKRSLSSVSLLSRHRRLPLTSQPKAARRESAQNAEYKVFDGLIDATVPDKEVQTATSQKRTRQESHPREAVSDEAYSKMERKFAVKSGGLFVGSDPQAPRSLRKAKEKYMTPELKAARRQAFVELMEEYERPPLPSPPGDDLELLVQRPKGSFGKQEPQQQHRPALTTSIQPAPVLSAPPSRTADAIREHIQAAGRAPENVAEKPKPASKELKMAYAYEAMKLKGFTESEISDILRQKHEPESPYLTLATPPLRPAVQSDIQAMRPAEAEAVLDKPDPKAEAPELIQQPSRPSAATEAESASLSEASQETPPTRPEALESVPPCLEVAGDVAQVGNQPTVSEMIEQAASPSSHTATEELQPELRTPPARQTGAHESPRKEEAERLEDMRGQRGGHMLEEQRQLLRQQIVREAETAQAVKRTGERTTFRVLRFTRGGALVQSIAHGFQGFLPHGSMSPQTAAKSMQHLKSIDNHLLEEINFDGFVRGASVAEEDHSWTARGAPRREVFISELEPNSSKDSSRTKRRHSKEVAAVLKSSKGAVVDAAVREVKNWGTLVEFDVQGPDGSTSSVAGAISSKRYIPPGQSPKVGSVVKAVILGYTPETQRTYLSMRLLPGSLEQQVAIEGSIPEAEQVCAALASRGLRASLGQRQEGLAYAPELQVFLNKQSAAGSDSWVSEAECTYRAAVRSGNETQDIKIETKLDWAAVRGVVTDIVEQTLTISEARSK